MSLPRLPPGVGATGARRLFSEHFLADRVRSWPEFQTGDAGALRASLLALWEAERATLSGANEGQTEERFIRPVLRQLGHAFTLFADIPGTGKTPDYFLYVSDAQRAAADQAGGWEKVNRAAAVGDAKRFDLRLDRRAPEGEPVAQIRDYVLLSKRPFGLLTNGRNWRLYARDSGLLERACHEVDLVRLLEEGSDDDVRYFTAFFGSPAFVPGPDGRSFLERALDDSALHAVEVSDALERAVFTAVAPIAEGLLGIDARTRGALDEAFANALVFLYRVLFCLFAEARELLPLANPGYRRYSIAEHRLAVAGLVDGGTYLSPASDSLFADLQALFRMVDRGDLVLGVTEYDGGLFDRAEHPWLEGRSVSDEALAPALDGIYRFGGNLVDYADLSVRTLGTIYERLLAWELVEQQGVLVLAESPRRHELGSYFTPEPIVDAIVERTLDPIVVRRSSEIRQRGLAAEDVLDAFLRIRVLDPAIGSGHFLVSAADYLAQAIATDPSYDGDLSLDELRRLVAERCLYGVDLNPLAVELARLSLWLETAREGEPLTFLANLRVGDSLVGADSSTLLDPTTGLLEAHIAQSAGALLRQVSDLQQRATHTGAEAREKRRLARQIEGLRLPLEVFAEQSIERFRPPADRPRLHWPLEFPEVFVGSDGRPIDDGGFDAVIGNPPYIRVQEIGRDVADYCRARFATPRGAFDAYLVFLERGLQLLRPDGRLGFIVPNKLFKLDFAQRMRALLAERELVEEVLDFGDSQLFAAVTNYTCILVLDGRRVPELDYRRLHGTRETVLAELAGGGAIPAQRFRTSAFGAEPWLLVPPAEAALISSAESTAERLEAATAQIFQGLITGADDVFVLEDRGRREGLQIVWSRASDRELELEPDLLHALASGVDVLPYSFRRLSSLLLFPYFRGHDGVRLITADELDGLPRTKAYLEEHEQRLRGRERRRMDHGGWYGFSRHQSLGGHDGAKLAVPRLCRRLRVAFDGAGAVYLDNVDVNGIHLREGAASPWLLLVLLNARLLDWIFRRGSVPFQNQYWSANRQFIMRLPIRRPDAGDADRFDDLGRLLHSRATAIASERGEFLAWLRGALEAASANALPGQALLERYETATADQLVRAFAKGRSRLGVDPRGREVRELLEREHRASVDRLLPLLSELRAGETEADEAVYELYELDRAKRELVDAEYT